MINVLRYILSLYVVMLFSVIGANMAFAVPMDTSEVSFFQAENTRLTQVHDVGFAARAPPMAGANVTATGGVTVMQGSAFALHGQETVAALFGFGGDLKAPKGGAGDFFSGGAKPKASELKSWAEGQGWKPTQTTNGPLTYLDSNGIKRLTIKQGRGRAPGCDKPHVEVRDLSGQRIDPATGRPTARKDPVGNHRPIDYDL